MDEELNKFEIVPEYQGKIDAYDIITSPTVGNSVRIGINKRKASSLIILADSANTATVLVGRDEPTFPLSAGSSITLRDINPENIRAKSTALSQKLHIIMSY